jgi:hypothetical protein
MPVPPPQKPFPNYKWRWATFAPSEGLNEPPVYLGVLRVLKNHEGERANSEILANDLLVVEEDLKNTLGIRVSLARSTERNLLRNSKQYWTALGLLTDDIDITLTPFGRRIAEGHITSTEFAAIVVKTLELPNRNLETDISEWTSARLRIKPLELILNILEGLKDTHGPDSSYITPNELIKIVIPLAGDKAPVATHVQAIWEHRNGILNVSTWANCAPESNDRRMAREFLIFLANYGYCRVRTSNSRYDDKYVLDALTEPAIRDLSRLAIPTTNVNDVITSIRNSDILSFTERRRVLAEVLARPAQPRFRRDVLRAANHTCLLTGETIKEVLEAAHIIPVKHKGSDTVDNGLCLRADLHNLFDAKHLRIAPDCRIVLSEIVQQSRNYQNLPTRITLPPQVNRDAINWRWKYY